MSVEIIFSEPFFFSSFIRKPKLMLRTNQKSQSDFPEAGWGKGLGWYGNSTQRHFLMDLISCQMLCIHLVTKTIYSLRKTHSNGSRLLIWNVSCWCLENNFQCLLFFFFHMLMLYFGMKLLISTYSGHFCSGCLCRFSIAYLIMYSSTRRGLRPNNFANLCPTSTHPKWPLNWLELRVTLERHFWNEPGAVRHTYYPRFRLESNSLLFTSSVSVTLSPKFSPLL